MGDQSRLIYYFAILHYFKFLHTARFAPSGRRTGLWRHWMAALRIFHISSSFDNQFRAQYWQKRVSHEKKASNKLFEIEFRTKKSQVHNVYSYWCCDVIRVEVEVFSSRET